MGKITIITEQKPNEPPKVDAGANQTINLPATQVTLRAVAVDTDGYITTVQWSKLSGGNATLRTPTLLETVVSGLALGKYVFQVIVFDNYGASAVDTVEIEIKNFNTMPFTWVGGTVDCIKADGINTGKRGFTTLKKVSEDGNAFPLDINNQRISETGLPQDTKPNVPSDSNYIVPVDDLAACPIPMYAWAKISYEQPITYQQTTYAYAMLRIYKGKSNSTPPEEIMANYLYASYNNIGVAYCQTGAFTGNGCNEFAVSTFMATNKLLEPPNLNSRNTPNYPRLPIGQVAGNGNGYMTFKFQGKNEGDWLFLGQVT